MAGFNEAPWRLRFRAPRVTLPSWARDAPERLLYASNAGGKWELHAWDRVAGTHRQVTDRPEGTMQGRLDPAGERIWWFDDQHGDELGRWIGEPFGGGPASVVAPEMPRAYSAGIALARDFAVIGSSTESGSAVHRVRSGEPPRLLYHHRESASVSGLSRDESLLCLGHSEHGDSRHPALRVLDVDGRTVAELGDGPGRGLWAAGWSGVNGDGRLLVMHERQDARRPLIWTPVTGEVRELPVDLPGQISAGWYPDGSALVIVHDHRGRSEMYRLDLSDETISAVVNNGGTIGGAAVRPDGEIWYAWSASHRAPGVYAAVGTVRESAGGKETAGEGRGDAPNPRGLGKVMTESGGSSHEESRERTVLQPSGLDAPDGASYQTHDANGVPIFVAEPAGPRPHPTVFWIHGGPTAHDRDEYSPRVQAWVDHGLAVVLVNYRGSSGHGRAWRDAMEGNPGFTELKDIAKAHDWAIASGIAGRSRCVLAGGSWGGYLTLLGLGTQPERWAAGVAVVPVADYVAAYEDEMEPLKAFDRALFGGSPEDKPELYRERSPITYVEQVRAPVLILAGESDPRCPIRQIDNYITRLAHLEKPHEVYRYHAGHGSLVVDETIRHHEVMLAFVARHAGTSEPA